MGLLMLLPIYIYIPVWIYRKSHTGYQKFELGVRDSAGVEWVWGFFLKKFFILFLGLGFWGNGFFNGGGGS